MQESENPRLSDVRRRLLADKSNRMLRRQRPLEQIVPWLSAAERAHAVSDGGLLMWMPGGQRWDIKLDARPKSKPSLHSGAQSSGALVMAGTAGTTYLLLRGVVAMRDHWGVEVDLALVLQGMLAVMVNVEHHTFHEVMAGAQLFFDQAGAVHQAGAAHQAARAGRALQQLRRSRQLRGLRRRPL